MFVSWLCSQRGGQAELEEAAVDTPEEPDLGDPENTETEERVTLDDDSEAVNSSSISEVMKGGSGAGSEPGEKSRSTGTGGREAEGSEGGGSTGEMSDASDEGRSAG